MTRTVIAIDPGPTTSGVVILDADVWPPRVMAHDRAAPSATLGAVAPLVSERHLLLGDIDVAIEWLTSYGTVVGRSTLDTARAVGRYEERFTRLGATTHLLTRPEVGRILCPGAGVSGTPSGSQLAEAIRSIYHDAGLATGGGADPTKGTRAQPGPLYGLALGNHEGSALAVGLAWLLRERRRAEAAALAPEGA